MEYEITDECIIEEYLSNWFSYEELAEYLCISKERVSLVLDNFSAIASTYGMKKLDSVRLHKLHIERYLRGEKPKEPLSFSEKRILKMADFIIDNKASIRQTAKEFNCGKSTIFDYMKEQLPNISIEKYKEVFLIMMENKSFSTNNKKVIEQVLKSFELLKMGMSSSEICANLGIGRSVLQRNLTTRLKKIDSKKYKEALSILNQHQLEALKPFESNQSRFSK